jgi:hypothetical protein
MWHQLVHVTVAEFAKLPNHNMFFEQSDARISISILGQSVSFIIGLEQGRKATILLRHLTEIGVPTGDNFELELSTGLC